MRKSCKSNITLLRERIERNMEEFKVDVSQMEAGAVFELAPSIAAAIDVHFYMTTHEWTNEEQSEYFLQFDNPLRYLAYAWKECLEERNAEFGKLIDGLVGNGEDYYGGYGEGGEF